MTTEPTRPTPTTPTPVVAPTLTVAPTPPETLESRISRRKDELVSQLAELQANAEIGAVEARDKLKARLSQLAHHVKEGVVDGWANINDATRSKLDRWLEN
jgi:hypothetical protein